MGIYNHVNIDASLKVCLISNYYLLYNYITIMKKGWPSPHLLTQTVISND